MPPVRALSFCCLLMVAAAPAASAVEVVCHRGANEYAPENTYPAAQLCIDWGAEWVEIDVRTSADGVMYLLHDATVDRTTDGQGRLAEMTSDQIDALDAGSWFDSKYAGERIPRLEEFLRWIQAKAKVYFDVKACDLRELIALVHELKMENDCFFWFGNPLLPGQFRKLDDTLLLKINASTAEQVEQAHERYGAQIIETGLSAMSEELVEACRQRDIKIMIRHGDKDEDAFRQVIEWKADMINLDHADVFLKVRREVLGK